MTSEYKTGLHTLEHGVTTSEGLPCIYWSSWSMFSHILTRTSKCRWRVNTQKLLQHKNEYVGFLFCIFFFFKSWDFPGSPVIEFAFQCRGYRFNPVSELGSHMTRGQKTQIIKQKHYCNKLNKDFENGPHQKTLKKKSYQTHPIPTN